MLRASSKLFQPPLTPKKDCWTYTFGLLFMPSKTFFVICLEVLNLCKVAALSQIDVKAKIGEKSAFCI